MDIPELLQRDWVLLPAGLERIRHGSDQQKPKQKKSALLCFRDLVSVVSRCDGFAGQSLVKDTRSRQGATGLAAMLLGN